MRHLLITLSTLLLAMPASAQQIYKWVDKDGTVHFTDSPPDDSVNAERRVMGNSARAVAQDASRVPETSAEPGGDDIDALYTPEQRSAGCQQARANHTTLLTMPIIQQDLDGDGVAEELNDAQKADALARAEAQIRLLCVDGNS